MSYNRIQRIVYPDENLAAIVAGLGSDTDVILASGVHVLTDRIYIGNKSRFSIRGGPDAVVRQTIGVRSIIEFGGTCQDVTIEGFVLDCNVVGANSGQHIQFTSSTLTRIRFLNLTFTCLSGSANYEILWTDGDNVLTDIQFIGCVFSLQYYFNGLAFEMAGGTDTIDGLLIESCIFRAPASNSGIAIWLESGGLSQNIRNVTIQGNVFYGGTFALNFVMMDGVDDAVIANNISRAARGDHVSLENNCTNVVISGNVFVAGADEAIEALATTTETVIVGNICRSQAGTAISLVGTSYRNQILDNYVRDPGEFGIYLDAGIHDIVCAGNYLQNCDDGSFYIGYAGGAQVYNIVVKGGMCRSPITDEGIDTWNLVNSIIDGVHFEDCDNAIEFHETCAHVTVEGCYICITTSDGIIVEAASNHLLFHALYIYDNANDSIECRGDYCQIISCYSYSSGDEGFQFGTSVGPAYADYGQIESCYAMAAVGEGIQMEYAREDNCSKNRCVQNGSNGIEENVNSDQNLYGVNHLRGNTGPATNFLGTNRTEYNNKT